MMHRLWRMHCLLALVATLWVIYRPGPLSKGAVEAGFFILIHSFIVVRSLHRFGTAESGFLYSRGYEMNCLWRNFMVCSWICAAFVLVPVFVAVELPIRSAIQNYGGESPYYPLMPSKDRLLPLWWTLEYFLLFAGLHYAWIREAREMKDRLAGKTLFLALLMAMICWFNVPNASLSHYPVYRGMVIALALMISVILFHGGRKLHQEMEVER